VPAAIHVCPEAIDGGPLARVRDGDLLRVDGQSGTLEVLVDAAALADRSPAAAPAAQMQGCGRELFGFMRAAFSSAEQGASAFTAGRGGVAMKTALVGDIGGTNRALRALA